MSSPALVWLEALLASEPEFVESEPELASGLETAFVAEGLANVLDAPPVAEAVASADAEAEPDGEADSAGATAAATNGFTLLPPVPEVRSRLNEVSELCCEIEAETSSVSKASPDFEA